MSHASREQKKTKARKEKLRLADHERRLRRARTPVTAAEGGAASKSGVGAGRSGSARLPRRSFDFTYSLFTTADGLEIDNMPQVRRRLAMPVIFTGLYGVVSAAGFGLSEHMALQGFIFAALGLACIWPLRARQRVLISTERDVIATRPSFLSRQRATDFRLSAVEVFDTAARTERVVSVIARLKDGSQIDLFDTSPEDEQGTHKLLRYLRDPALAGRD